MNGADKGIKKALKIIFDQKKTEIEKTFKNILLTLKFIFGCFLDKKINEDKR